MNTTKNIGRVGTLAVALGVGFAAAPVSTASAATPRCTPTDATCALIMGFTSLPTPDKIYIEAVGTQYIAPTHSGRIIEYIPVTTPEEAWPLTGGIRLGCALVGSRSLCGPGGAAWPDEPWWKLTGLFDLTYDQSNEVGLAALEKAMAENPSDHLVIYGYSQGATIANMEKQKLAEQYPDKSTAPDIDFVLGGDPNLPNGGLEARFPGLRIPILNWSFNGPEPTDTPFDTVVITRQYDFIADFPLYPLNLIADLNAMLGFFYVHLNAFDVSLADGEASTAITTTHGDTTYYFFETQDLPLFGPLRTLGVPEPVIDVFEPFFREVVELGYDRSLPAWQPTPARLIPRINPVTTAGNFVDAVEEGIDNARALVQPQIPAKTPAVSLNTVTHDVDQQAELLTNESVGAEESLVDGRKTSNPEGTEGRTNESTAVAKDQARPTPLRDAMKNLSRDIRKVVAGVSDGIKKALPVGKHNVDRGASDSNEGHSSDSSSG